MNASEWILTIVIAAAFFSFNLWLRRYSKAKMAEIGKAEEYKVNTESAGAVMFPLLGLAMMGMLWVIRSSIPPGNEPIVWVIACIGVLFILYGLFKWYRLKHR